MVSECHFLLTLTDYAISESGLLTRCCVSGGLRNIISTVVEIFPLHSVKIWRVRSVRMWVKALSGSWGSGAAGHGGRERETSTAQHIKEAALTFMFWSIELKWSSTAPWITARKHSARPDNSRSGGFLRTTMTLNKKKRTFMRRFYVTGLNV